jgi:hypothetical protein
MAADDPRPEVVSELRAMFREGAVPSRLIRHIVERHEGEQRFHLLIQRYFLDAFGVPIVRGLNPIDDYQHADLRLSQLNQQLLHEMIEKKSEWDRGGEESWLDNLKATEMYQRIEEAGRNLPAEIKRIWPTMTPQEQRHLQVMIASAQYSWETVQIMSRLLEALQHQVNELRTPAEVPGG